MPKKRGDLVFANANQLDGNRPDGVMNMVSHEFSIYGGLGRYEAEINNY